MSYDNSNNFVVNYQFSCTNATLAQAASIRVPTHKGIRSCAIEDIQVTPSVAIVNTTTPAIVQIGTAGSSGKYAAQNVSTTAGLAIGDTYGCADLDGRVAAYNPQATSGLGSTNKGFIDLLNDGDVVGTLLTKLKVGTVVGVGTPAGTFVVSIAIRWF